MSEHNKQVPAVIHDPTAIDTRYTQDVIPVLDTSKFEHMQRIACVMAKTAMLPDSLRFEDPKERTKPFDHDTVIATCFRIVNQAVRWGFDPFAVSDCASMIRGRLLWEGKLVHAVVAAKLGVNLNYRFTDEGKGRDLGIIVSGILPNEAIERTISGRVKDWHTGDKGAWSSEGAWPRQLRYRGAREWARAHAPHIMLGVYVDDELEDMALLDVPSGQRAIAFKARKSSSSAKKDGTDKLFNEIRSEIAGTESREHLAHLKNETYAEAWGEMPHRWAEILDNEYEDKMQTFTQREAAE